MARRQEGRAPVSPAATPCSWPPGSDGSTPRTWPAGRYRVELLMGASIERIDVAIPGRFERIPADRAATVRPAGTAETMGIRPVLGPPGLFVIDRGAIERLNVRPVEPFDEAGVWLSSVSEGGNRSEIVATIFRPLATGHRRAAAGELDVRRCGHPTTVARHGLAQPGPGHDRGSGAGPTMTTTWSSGHRSAAPGEPGTYAIDVAVGRRRTAIRSRRGTSPSFPGWR